MFNAIFGNFLFSSSSSNNNNNTNNNNNGRDTVSVAETVSNTEQIGKQKTLVTEASTQTTSTSNQTSLDYEKYGVGSNDDKHVLTDTRMTSTANGSSSNPLDWVIIDPSEGNMSIEHVMDESHIEKSNQGENLVDMGCNTDAIEETKNDNKKINDDDGDVLLGSFFDKNEHDDDLSSGHVINSRIFHSGLGLSNDDNNESDNDANESEASKEIKKVQEAPVKRDETWLITPLPCLTSITESSNQRSMIDNYPLENLLIEHPSMSVFISATTQNNSLPATTCSPRQQKLSQSVSLPLINASNQIEVTQLDDISSGMTVKVEESVDIFGLNKANKMKKKHKKASKKNHRIPKRNVPRRSVKFDKKPEEPVIDFDLEPIVFILGDDEEKCELQEAKLEEQTALEEYVPEVADLEPSVEIVEATVLQQIAVVEQQIDSANSSISSCSKKSRKAKKAKSSTNGAAGAQPKTGIKSSSNKENMQVKTLLMNEVKKCGVHQNGTVTRLEFTYNKNQMKRNNKNCFSMRNVNSQQRKYHKLQQPSFSFNIQQF